MPLPWTHMYSVPDRSTPRSTTGAPAESTSSFPDTCNCGAVAPGAAGAAAAGGGASRPCGTTTAGTALAGRVAGRVAAVAAAAASDAPASIIADTTATALIP